MTPSIEPCASIRRARRPRSEASAAIRSAKPVSWRWPVTSESARASGPPVSFRAADQDILAGVAQQFAGVGLVHAPEVRRDAGLERKAAEQRLAEGVDGLDLHAARRVEHPREQLARARISVGVVGRPAEQRRRCRRELGVRQRRPVGRAVWRCGSPSRPPPPGCRSGTGCARVGARQHQASTRSVRTLVLPVPADAGPRPRRRGRRRGAGRRRPIAAGCSRRQSARRQVVAPAPPTIP